MRDAPTPRPDGIGDAIGEVYVMGTWRCNLRCRMCPMWGERGWCRDGEPVPERLDPDRLAAWLAEAPGGLRPRTVTISGGEPLLWPAWAPLARNLDAAGLRVALTTNATMLAEVPDGDLAPLHQLNVSLDGPPMVLAAIDRGGEQTLRRAVEGLRRVLRFRGAGGRPRLRLLTVITPEGVGHLVELVEHLEAAGVRFDSLVFQHAMVLDAATAAAQRAALEALLGPGVDTWDALVGTTTGVDADALLAELSELRRRRPDTVVSPALHDDEVRAYYADPRYTPARLGDRCPGQSRDLTITPGGEVWICPGHAVGHVEQDSLAAIWNGPRATALRRHVATHGLMPGCRGCFTLYSYR